MKCFEILAKALGVHYKQLWTLNMKFFEITIFQGKEEQEFTWTLNMKCFEIDYAVRLDNL